MFCRHTIISEWLINVNFPNQTSTAGAITLLYQSNATAGTITLTKQVENEGLWSSLASAQQRIKCEGCFTQDVQNKELCEVCDDNICQTLRPDNTTTVFWLSTTALPVYGLLSLYALTGCTIFWFGLCYVFVKLGMRVASPWIAYILDDFEAQRSYRYLREIYQLHFFPVVPFVIFAISKAYSAPDKKRNQRLESD